MKHVWNIRAMQQVVTFTITSLSQWNRNKPSLIFLLIHIWVTSVVLSMCRLFFFKNWSKGHLMHDV